MKKATAAQAGIIRNNAARQRHAAKEQQPFRCAECGIAVRRGMNDPCDCTRRKARMAMTEKAQELIMALTEIVALQPEEPEGPAGGSVDDTLDQAFEAGKKYGRWQAAQIALEALKLFKPGDLGEKPQFEHTCEKCTFLGQFGKFDLYFCLKGSDPDSRTVVSRFGDATHEYSGGLSLETADIVEAKRRAKERGLL